MRNVVNGPIMTLLHFRIRLPSVLIRTEADLLQHKLVYHSRRHSTLFLGNNMHIFPSYLPPSLSMFSTSPSPATSVWFAVWPCILMSRGQRAAFKRAGVRERGRERDLEERQEVHPGSGRTDGVPISSKETERKHKPSSAPSLLHPSRHCMWILFRKTFVDWFSRNLSFRSLFLKKHLCLFVTFEDASVHGGAAFVSGGLIRL